MVTSQLALAALFMVAAAPEPILLTPATVAEYDYFFRCVVRNPHQKNRVESNDLVEVSVRFAPKRKGIYGLGAKDLEAIKAVSLVMRDGDAVHLSVPLRTEVDLGNYVHLRARFSVQRDLLPKMQLTFEEHGEAGKRTFVANLKDFVEE